MLDVDTGEAYTEFGLTQNGHVITYEVFPGETSYTDSPDFFDRGTALKLGGTIARVLMAFGDSEAESANRVIAKRNNDESSPD